jgi:hypothetical protein
MPPRPDWNLRMVRSREARALLPNCRACRHGSTGAISGRAISTRASPSTPCSATGPPGPAGDAADRSRRSGCVLTQCRLPLGQVRQGRGHSYATVHVATAAAMWLLLPKDDIARAYGEAWQHVEAFRRLLRTTARPIDGTPPPNRTGVLDIEQLLLAALPAPRRLSKRAPTETNGREGGSATRRRHARAEPAPTGSRQATREIQDQGLQQRLRAAYPAWLASAAARRSPPPSRRSRNKLFG